MANAIATLIGWLSSAISKVGEFAQSLKNSAVGKFVSGVGEGISNFAGKAFGGNAKGTDDFEGGWTRIHEAGDEMIQAKHTGGVAYLPRGSAVIPASKTEEILSDDKNVGSKVINITAQLQMPESKRQLGDGIVDGNRAAPSPTPNLAPVVQMLKELGIAVVFEKESINTMEATSELMLSFMSAFAQAESESISANVTWGKRRAYQEGKVAFQYSRFYGYEKGGDGQPKIIPEQAAVVRRIFRTYLAGQSLRQIKDELESAGIPSSTGKPDWSVHTLQYMIRNEKYIGDAILQKTYMVDCISKKAKKNNGEVPKYYITDNHAAIIDRDIWNRVQEEIARRAGKHKTSQKQTRTGHGKYSGKYALSELLVCGDCGAHYRRVTWSRNGVKRVVWRCISRLEQGTKYCKKSPTIDENRLHEAIVDAFNRYAEDKDEILAVLRASLRYAMEVGQDDGPDIQVQIRERQEAMMKLVSDSMNSGIEQNDSEFKRLSDEIVVLQDKLAAQKKTASDIQNDRSGIDAMITLLEAMEHYLPGYDDALTRQMVERVTINDSGTITVRFKLGAEYECEL